MITNSVRTREVPKNMSLKLMPETHTQTNTRASSDAIICVNMTYYLWNNSSQHNRYFCSHTNIGDCQHCQYKQSRFQSKLCCSTVFLPTQHYFPLVTMFLADILNKLIMDFLYCPNFGTRSSCVWRTELIHQDAIFTTYLL